MLDRHTVVPAVYLLFRKEEKILLSRRFNTGYRDGEYGLVSGHVDVDESYITAAVREAKEEVGVDLGVNQLVLAHILHRKHDIHPGDSDRVEWFFYCDEWSGEIKNIEPNKCDDLLWCTLEDLPENTIPYLQHVFKHLRQGSLHSSFDF